MNKGCRENQSAVIASLETSHNSCKKLMSCPAIDPIDGKKFIGHLTQKTSHLTIKSCKQKQREYGNNFLRKCLNLQQTKPCECHSPRLLWTGDGLVDWLAVLHLLVCQHLNKYLPTLTTLFSLSTRQQLIKMTEDWHLKAKVACNCQRGHKI